VCKGGMRTGTCAAAPGAWRLVGRASFAPCSPLIMALIGRGASASRWGGAARGAGPQVGGGGVSYMGGTLPPRPTTDPFPRGVLLMAE